MHCPKCKKELDFPYGKIPFRASCPHCSVDLHSCHHCKHHNPSMPNECSLKNSLFVRDRKAYNFCEDFSLKQKEEKKEIKPSNVLKRFLEDQPTEPNKKGKAAFDDLFIN